MHIAKLTANLAVRDIKQTVAFYTEYLGFELVMVVPESQSSIEQSMSDSKDYVYALMRHNEVEIMFQRLDTFKQDIKLAEHLNIAASVSFYMEVVDIVEVYQSMRNTNNFVTELKTTWYGMREFYMQDINGYILGFAEQK